MDFWSITENFLWKDSEDVLGIRSLLLHNIKDPSYGLADKGRHRNRGLFRLHGVGNQNRKNMN